MLCFPRVALQCASHALVGLLAILCLFEPHHVTYACFNALEAWANHGCLHSLATDILCSPKSEAF